MLGKRHCRWRKFGKTMSVGGLDRVARIILQRGRKDINSFLTREVYLNNLSHSACVGDLCCLCPVTTSQNQTSRFKREYEQYRMENLDPRIP